MNYKVVEDKLVTNNFDDLEKAFCLQGSLPVYRHDATYTLQLSLSFFTTTDNTQFSESHVNHVTDTLRGQSSKSKRRDGVEDRVQSWSSDHQSTHSARAERLSPTSDGGELVWGEVPDHVRGCSTHVQYMHGGLVMHECVLLLAAFEVLFCDKLL